jgi:hypothetical protein
MSCLLRGVVMSDMPSDFQCDKRGVPEVTEKRSPRELDKELVKPAVVVLWLFASDGLIRGKSL